MSTAAVDAGRLLRELDEQWRHLGKSESGGVLRACAMTLIVVSRGGQDPQKLGGTLAELARRHPSRTILLRVDEQASEPLEARTTLQCWMPFGKRQQICCEQIELTAQPGRLDEVPPVLLGLVVPDLPIVMWCSDLELACLPPLESVLKLAGKLIVDSTTMDSPAAALTALQKLKAGPWQLADLAWTRITRWRETVSQLLSSGEWSECPGEHAEVTWAGQPPAQTALYLAAWIAATFDWKGDLADRLNLSCTDPVRPPKGTGRVRMVRLSGKSRQLTLRRPAGIGVAIEIDGRKSQVIFPILTEAVLLNEELNVFGPDPHFDAAFEHLPATVGRLGAA
jgi:glucose-6-phosphate dehydrogenase assembly protein OpcA